MKEIVLRESASGVFEPRPTRSEKRAAKRAAEKRREFWDTIEYFIAAAVVVAMIAGFAVLSAWLSR